MTREKVTQARYWFERDECPGCGGRLSALAGVRQYHYLGGQRITTGGHGDGGYTVTVAGQHAGPGMPSDDPRVCPYDADALAALTHIAIGVVTVNGSRA